MKFGTQTYGIFIEKTCLMEKEKNHHVHNVIVMAQCMDQSIWVVGKIFGKLHFKMKNIKQAQKKFTFNKGKMIGDFEGYYKNFKNPFL